MPNKRIKIFHINYNLKFIKYDCILKSQRCTRTFYFRYDANERRDTSEYENTKSSIMCKSIHLVS